MRDESIDIVNLAELWPDDADEQVNDFKHSINRKQKCNMKLSAIERFLIDLYKTEHMIRYPEIRHEQENDETQGFILEYTELLFCGSQDR
jgi:hypothetical protein